MKIFEKIKNNESSGGILIIIATILALFAQNTFLADFYSDFLRLKSGIVVGEYKIIKPVILWVNDGLMALFFFYIGLEVKREIMIGELSNAKKIALPVIGGLGGVIIPAIIFMIFNLGDDFALKGWAIPTVSDTAFAIGILMLLKSKIPYNLKIFLLLLAIIDDICAVIIVAVFYTSSLSWFAIFFASLAIMFLLYLNYKNNTNGAIYAIVGAFLWIFFLESGIHSTIAGIAAAIFIPLRSKDGEIFIERLKDSLHGFVTYFIMPIFAFVNAGVALTGEAFAALFSGVSLGIFFGLIIGKPLGVFVFSYIAVKLRITQFPVNTNIMQFFGVCVLTAIGASMSLFIDSIAYEDSDIFAYADKLSILFASFLASIVGYIILKRAS